MKIACINLMALVVCAHTAFAAGCGDDNDGPSPEDQCEMLLDAFCDRFQHCAEEMGETAPANFHKQCVDAQKTAISCADAISVDSSYDECVAEIDDFSCGVLARRDTSGAWQVRLPSSCENVIETED